MSEKEGGQSGSSPQASAVTVSDIQELIRRKEEIEAQIKANYDVLESVSVGAGLPGGVGGTPRPPDSALLTRGTGRPVRPPLERPAVVDLSLPRRPQAPQLRPLSAAGSEAVTFVRTKTSVRNIASVCGAGRCFPCFTLVSSFNPRSNPITSPILGTRKQRRYFT